MPETVPNGRVRRPGEEQAADVLGGLLVEVRHVGGVGDEVDATVAWLSRVLTIFGCTPERSAIVARL